VIWHPREDVLLMTDVRVQGNKAYMHLLRFDLDSEEIVDLSEMAQTEDSAAAWAPDGQQLVVVRRTLTETDRSFSSQLWLMEPDGSQARPLTNDPDLFHGTPVWSPDGNYLLFHAYSLAESLGRSRIYVLNIGTGEQREIVEGNRPVWLP